MIDAEVLRIAEEISTKLQDLKFACHKLDGYFMTKKFNNDEQQPVEHVQAEEPKQAPVEHAVVKKQAGRQAQPIDIYKDGVLLKQCSSKTDVKNYLHWGWGTIMESIDKGPLRNGIELRTHAELDDCLSEIASNNKKPYQFTH